MDKLMQRMKRSQSVAARMVCGVRVASALLKGRATRTMVKMVPAAAMTPARHRTPSVNPYTVPCGQNDPHLMIWKGKLSRPLPRLQRE